MLASLFIGGISAAQAAVGFEDGHIIVSKFMDSNSDQSGVKRNTRVHIVDDCATAKFDKEVVSYGSMIEKLGGVVNSPADFENSLEGFQEFLERSGVEHFTAQELGITTHIKLANRLGFKNLIPAKGCWLRGVALSLLMEKIRSAVASPVQVTSWYRPRPYNGKIGGSPISDHIQAKAMDIHFGSYKVGAKAQKYLCKNFWQDDYFGLQAWTEKQNEKLNISVGLGGSYMHIGLGSLPGRGWWTYRSLFTFPKIRTSCWYY